MNEENKTPSPPRRRRRWRWWFLIVGTVLILTVGPLLAVFYYSRYLANVELQAAIDSLDRTDPRWRLQEIEADRAEVPAEENGALRVLAARRELPERWQAPEIEPDWRHLLPAQRLEPSVLAAYRQELGKHPAALAAARQMIQFDHGRYSFIIAPDVFSTPLPHLEELRKVGWWLVADALLRTEEGDANAALRSCRALVNVAASVGDEPILISQAVRIAVMVYVCQVVERILGQGQATDEELALLQDRLRTEDALDLSRWAARGDRGSLHQVATQVESGTLSLGSLFDKPAPPTWRERIESELGASHLLRSHQRGLELMNEYVAVTELPLQQRAEQLAALEATVRAEKMLYAGLFVLGWKKWLETFQRHHALLRTTQVALAAERYRLKHGEWPIALGIMTPEFLSEAPTDPYVGGPVRFVWRDGGVLIYCLGADGTDDRGTFNRERPNTPGTDMGVQLWPVSQRRQAAPRRPPDMQNDE